MDDKEIAIASLVLLGVMIETHTEQGISTPPFYQALSGAIELSEALGVEELTTRLQCLQMECGEIEAQMAERAKALTEKFGDLNELLERLTGESE